MSYALGSDNLGLRIVEIAPNSSRESSFTVAPAKLSYLAAGCSFICAFTSRLITLNILVKSYKAYIFCPASISAITEDE